MKSVKTSSFFDYSLPFSKKRLKNDTPSEIRDNFNKYRKVIDYRVEFEEQHLLLEKDTAKLRLVWNHPIFYFLYIYA